MAGKKTDLMYEVAACLSWAAFELKISGDCSRAYFYVLKGLLKSAELTGIPYMPTSVTGPIQEDLERMKSGPENSSKAG